MSDVPTTHVSIATVNPGGVKVLPSANSIMLNCTLQPLGTIVDLRLFMPYVGNGFGLTVLPAEGDELIALFPDGNLQMGLALWGMFNGVDKVPAGTGPGMILMEGRPGDSLRAHIRGNVSIEIDLDEDTTIHGGEKHTVDLNRDTLVSMNDSREVGMNDSHVVGLTQSTTVGINRSKTVGVNDSTQVGVNRSVAVGVNDTKSVGVNQAETVGGFKELTVGGAHLETAGGLRIMNVGGLLTINVIGPATIASLHGITLSAPLINAVLAGSGQRLCNETLWELLKNHTHPGVGKSSQLEDMEDDETLTQVLRAQ